MTDDGVMTADHVLANRVSWDADADEWVERGRILWEKEEPRWGVWHVNFPHRMDSQEHARMTLEAVLPLLRPRWEEWRTWVETRSRPREPLWRRFRARFF